MTEMGVIRRNFSKINPGYTLDTDVIIDKLYKFRVVNPEVDPKIPPGSRYGQFDEYNPELGEMFFNCGGYMIIRDPKKDVPAPQPKARNVPKRGPRRTKKNDSVTIGTVE